MKATNNPGFSPLTAVILKIVGVILIVSSLIDYIALAIPFTPLDQQWQLNFASQIVDRGIIPMVGVAFLAAGYWIGSIANDSSSQPKIFQDLRFWAFLISSLLGLIFLLLVPIHLSNIGEASNQAIKQINQGASQAETQLLSQSQQVDSLVKNNQKLTEIDQAIKSGQVQGEQLARLQALREQLQKFKQDPQALNKQLEVAQNQIRTRKQDAENRAKQEAWKLGIRTGLSSLLLAFGYISIGWLGLRGLGGSKGSRRKAQTW